MTYPFNNPYADRKNYRVNKAVKHLTKFLADDDRPERAYADGFRAGLKVGEETNHVMDPVELDKAEQRGYVRGHGEGYDDCEKYYESLRPLRESADREANEVVLRKLPDPRISEDSSSQHFRDYTRRI